MLSLSNKYGKCNIVHVICDERPECLVTHIMLTLRKHAYSNLLKIVQPKKEKIHIKNSDIFSYIISKHRLWVLVRNIDCGYSLEPPRQGGSNEYPQSMVFKQNKKNTVYPCKPQFYCIKVGLKEVRIM